MAPPRQAKRRAPTNNNSRSNNFSGNTFNVHGSSNVNVNVCTGTSRATTSSKVTKERSSSNGSNKGKGIGKAKYARFRSLLGLENWELFVCLWGLGVDHTYLCGTYVSDLFVRPLCVSDLSICMWDLCMCVSDLYICMCDQFCSSLFICSYDAQMVLNGTKMLPILTNRLGYFSNYRFIHYTFISLLTWHADWTSWPGQHVLRLDQNQGQGQIGG